MTAMHFGFKVEIWLRSYYLKQGRGRRDTMRIGKVVGNIVSTKKHQTLVGAKFMRVELETKENIIAVDPIGAGIGDDVIITEGHNTIYALSSDVKQPVDAIIIGIVDE